MSRGDKHAEAPAGQLAAGFLVRLLHPLSYPFLAFIVMYGEYVFEGFFWLPFIRPLIAMGVARNMYKRLRKKPPIKLKTQKQVATYARILEPAAMLAGLVVWLVFSYVFLRQRSTDYFWELVLFPTLLALGIRFFWNVSLHHISFGALTTIAYFSGYTETYFWIPMLTLTIAMYLGWAMVQLRRHSVLQSAVGFVAGVVAITIYKLAYLPLVWDASVLH